MIVKQIRLSNQAKDKLSRLKGKTGIKTGISYVDGLSVFLYMRILYLLMFLLIRIVMLKCLGILLLENIVKYMMH